MSVSRRDNMYEIKAVQGRKILFRQTYTNLDEALAKQAELEDRYWATASVQFTNLSMMKMRPH